MTDPFLLPQRRVAPPRDALLAFLQRGMLRGQDRHPSATALIADWIDRHRFEPWTSEGDTAFRARHRTVG